MLSATTPQEKTHREEILRLAKESISICFSAQKANLDKSKQAIESESTSQLNALELAIKVVMEKEENVRHFRKEATAKISETSSTMKAELRSAYNTRIGVNFSAQIGINSQGKLAMDNHQIRFIR